MLAWCTALQARCCLCCTHVRFTRYSRAPCAARIQARLEQQAAAATAHALDLERRSMECSAREGSVSHERADMDAREVAVAEREAAAAAAADAATAAAKEAAAERAAASSERSEIERSQREADERVAAHEARAAALEAAVGECTAARQQLREEGARLEVQWQDLVAREGAVEQQLADVQERVVAAEEERERTCSAKREVEVRPRADLARKLFGALPISCRVGLHASAVGHCVLLTTRALVATFGDLATNEREGTPAPADSSP